MKFPDYKMVSVDSLIPYARNSRTHSDEQVAQIAASIREFGFLNPIIVDGDNGIIAGHGRVLAAQKLKIEQLPCIEASHLTEAQRKAYVIADNKLALNAGWDDELLRIELDELKSSGFDITITGFSLDELAALDPEDEEEKPAEEDETPEPPEEPVSVKGDVWLLGKHRVMCGDSTSVDDVTKLMNGKIAQLLHADPPYGMGKEGDGVANDNLYDDKLDAFQMEWWATFRTFIADNASAYIWGNAPDLWRLWYRGGLADSERLTLRNQIVWNKKHGQGMSSADFRSFPTATEHCLFFMVGEQGFNNNADNYWEGWDFMLSYLKEEKEKSGLTIKELKKIAGHSETSGCHWFDKSQWMMPTKETYNAWKSYCGGKAFKREYDDLKRDFYATRAYFDNAHDNMIDVWEFGRVHGEERHGHATPKPVDMMVRVMRSSLPKDGICVEPFGGSGSTLMGAELSDRTCYTMELQGKYVDVIVKRWQNYTGKQAIHEESGKTFAEIDERQG